MTATRYRYTRASSGYGMAGIVGGGIDPLVATDIRAGTRFTTVVSRTACGHRQGSS